MTITAIDLIGYTAAVLLLAAYVLVAARRITGHSAAFHVLNLLGGAGLALNSGVNHAFPSAILNVIWMAIGAVAIARSWTRASRLPRQHRSGTPEQSCAASN